MILYGKPVVDTIKSWLMRFFSLHTHAYIALIAVGDDLGSQVYMRNKKLFGESIWCKVLIDHFEEWDDTTQVSLYTNIQHSIQRYNWDPHCFGVIIQLPLPSILEPFQQELCNLIDPLKDIDMMHSSNFSYPIGIYPAVVEGCIALLHYYQLDTLYNKKITIIGQSNLVGKPLAHRCRSQWAKVYCFDKESSYDQIMLSCQHSEYIFSATGRVWLVDHRYIASKESELPHQQTFIDIWYGFDKFGKAAWDMIFDDLIDYVTNITPVPGGIWPLCVALLFNNAKRMKEYRDHTVIYWWSL